MGDQFADQALKRRFDELKGVAENQETRVRYHETKAQNTAMAYLIWERIFAFGMSHYATSSPLNNCSLYWWMLFGFSLSCSSLYLMFFLKAAIMFYQAHNHLERVSMELIKISQQITTRYGLDCSFELLQQVYEYHPFPNILYVLFTLSALLAVTAFQLYTSYYSNVCNIPTLVKIFHGR